MAEFQADQWAKCEYGSAQIRDVRRTRRLVRLATELVQDSAASLPVAMKTWGQTKALYRFVDSEFVTHEAILAPHFAATTQRCRGEKRILVAQDTTHFSFGGRLDAKDLGPVDSTGKTRGFLAHSALVIGAEDRRPLGLVGQRVWSRPKKKRPKKETCAQRKLRPRESQKWEETVSQAHVNLATLGAECPHIVHVFDAEGDVFEALEKLDELGDGFIVRACRDRLLDGDDDDDEGREYLAEAVSRAPVLGHSDINIPARPGRTGRLSRFEYRSVEVRLQPPRNRNRVGESIEVSVVSAIEVEPPAGEDPVCWLLLTREPCATLDEAVSVTRDYATRWLIEEFHMGLKTGCAIETREFQTFARLTNILAIFSPIAIQMLVLRYVARATPSAPAFTVLAPTQLRALRVLRQDLPAQPTVRQALRAVAQIGGFLARKSDGEPGWRTLWLGYRDLLAAERVVLALG